MRYFRGIPEEKRLSAALKVEGWGYPRKLTVDEIFKSVWGEYGPDCIFWLQAVEEGSNRVLMPCVCADPVIRGHILTPRALVGLEICAEIMGATRLIVPKGYADDQRSMQIMRRFLRRCGWEENEHESFRMLGGP